MILLMEDIMNSNGRNIDLFDNLMQSVFRPMRFDPLHGMGSREDGGGLTGMRVDVSENDQSYVVKADLPGVKKEDIDVSVIGNRVVISGECREEKSTEEKNGRMLWSERYVGRFERGFELPQPIDDQAAQANYRDGTLEITLPKKQTDGTRRLEIH